MYLFKLYFWVPLLGNPLKRHLFFSLRAFSGHPSFEVIYKGLRAPRLTKYSYGGYYLETTYPTWLVPPTIRHTLKVPQG